MLSVVDSTLYESYDESPGKYLSSHISPRAHQVYSEKYLVPYIDRLIKSS